MVTQATDSKSRAVNRLIEPGTNAACESCGAQVKFQARMQLRQVIANVYESGTWLRVEHFHAECYDEAGEPYGAAAVSTPGPAGNGRAAI